MPSDAECAAFFDRHLSLLEAERETEREEFELLTAPKVLAGQVGLLEQRGWSLGGLGVRNINLALGGKTVVELERPTAYHTDPLLPYHTFSVGTPVRLIDHNAATGKAAKKSTAGSTSAIKPVEGVVSRVSDAALSVAIRTAADEADFELPSRIRLIKMPDVATFERMAVTLRSIRQNFIAPDEPVARGPNAPPVKHASLGHVQRLLLGLDAAAQPSSLPPDGQKEVDVDLNASQAEAVKHALEHEVTLVFGPPGTGKTHTLIAIISRLVEQGNRVLVSAASNLAVDNICERLHALRIPLTRIGHPARVLEGIVSTTLDHQAADSDAAELVRDLKSDINAALRQLSISGGKERLRGRARQEKYEEVRELRKDYRRREGGIVKGVVGQARVVCATCHGAGGRQLEHEKFDVVLIDEATQATEAACWIPLLKAQKKIILAGDPLQLPPTVKSATQKRKRAGKTNTKKTDATANGDATGGKAVGAADEPDSESEPATALLGTRREQVRKLEPPATLEDTLYDRLMMMGFDTSMLKVQYRMHERIMRFAADTLYQSKLEAAPSAKSRLMRDLPGVHDAEVDGMSDPVLFIDTSGAFMYDRRDGGHSESVVNVNEAELVVKHVKALIEAGVDPSQISCISPYSAQVALLISLLRPAYPTMQIGSIDSNQGRENEAVVISLVRSNAEGEVGFLCERRRLNVAMTRPKRHLAVIGDSSTLSKGSKYLEKWMRWLEDNAEVRVAGS